mgnify:CR=1 FL=1
MLAKNKFIDLVEECRVKFQESYEKEFGGNAKVITVFSEANTVVTFYISVRGRQKLVWQRLFYFS